MTMMGIAKSAVLLTPNCVVIFNLIKLDEMPFTSTFGFDIQVFFFTKHERPRCDMTESSIIRPRRRMVCIDLKK